ncbi:MAG: family 16 glycoside hydrolase [Terriglobia bacterium]
MNKTKQNRKDLFLIVLAGLLIVGQSAFAESKTWNFDKDKTQALPAGWLSQHTGQGAKGDWQVIADATAPSKPNVMAQLSADRTGYRFPLAIADNTNYKDPDMTVQFKTISGKEDQGAGLVWRYRDANNYYIVRANALEDNVVLYKVENGKRISLAPKGTAPNTYGVKHKVPGNTWNKLSVKVIGSLFTVSFNDQKLYEVEDNTFTQAGKVGLWTKADSVIHFDDLTVEGK